MFASPSQQYYTTGSDINLTCSVESRPPAQFQWFVNGDQLPDTGSELRLMNVQMSHSGNYSCETFNSITLISQKSQHSVVSVMGKLGFGGFHHITVQFVKKEVYKFMNPAPGKLLDSEALRS